MLKLILVLQILCLSYISIVTCAIVQTTTGPVKGKLNSFRKIKYNSYEGIPFAEPPIGDFRFKPPVPVTPWKKTLKALAPGAVCPQLDYFHRRSEMNESCLFLNIYVPVIKPAKPLPVFFFIHGGYYSLGSGSPTPVNGPQLLLEKGFIVVSPNYRKGALGFLSLGNINASGNAGLKDILLALKWFNDNVVKFGGDPKSINLFGNGAGASLVHYLLLTNQTTGLFQSAEIISGSAIGYRALQLNPRHNALKLASQLGIRYTNDCNLLNKLQQADAFDIVEAQEYIIRNDPRRAFVLRDLFSPTIEIPSENAIITKNPLDIIREEGLIQKVPIITGFNDQEGLEIFSILKDEPYLIDRLNENFELCIPPNIQYPCGSKLRRDLAKSIKEFYFDGRNITIFDTQNYINLISDTAYTYSIDYWINLYKKSKESSPVYYYYFKFDGQLNWGKLLVDITYPGAAHADDLGYTFVTNVTINRLQFIDSRSQKILNYFLNNDKNLATFGNPSPPQLGGLQWLETGINGEHLVVDDETVNVKERPIPERLAFWYHVYEKYYEYESEARK